VNEIDRLSALGRLADCYIGGEAARKVTADILRSTAISEVKGPANFIWTPLQTTRPTVLQPPRWLTSEVVSVLHQVLSRNLIRGRACDDKRCLAQWEEGVILPSELRLYDVHGQPGALAGRCVVVASTECALLGAPVPMASRNWCQMGGTG
jgi:hypothetical protein